MATVRDNLIAARALIDTPEKWGKEDYEPRPGCFCIFGAIAKVKGVEASPIVEGGPENEFLEEALPDDFDGGVVAFNDDPFTKHADIMALFDRAIAAAEATP